MLITILSLIIVVILIISIKNYKSYNKSLDLDTKKIEKFEVKKCSKDNKNANKKVRKEVFNIDTNNYTYEEAKEICKLLNGRLATMTEITKSYNKGANWCNYGWSANELALYPIQKEYYNKIQKSSLANTCGEPGVNGGLFDKNMKFGINC